MKIFLISLLVTSPSHIRFLKSMACFLTVKIGNRGVKNGKDNHLQLSPTERVEIGRSHNVNHFNLVAWGLLLY